MMRILLIAILLYFAYIFIFRFVIPVYIASRKIKKGFREMQDRMQQQMQQEQGYNPSNPEIKKEQPSKPSKGDYIEFEEIK